MRSCPSSKTISSDVADVELRINGFLEQEGVLPVNLKDYLKNLSVYVEKLNLSNKSRSPSRGGKQNNLFENVKKGPILLHLKPEVRKASTNPLN